MSVKQRLLPQQTGFTIVELMVATAVFSVVLLLASVSMTSIGRLYYKGINQARVQGTVRSVSDEIAQKLQLATTPVQSVKPYGPEWFAVGAAVVAAGGDVNTLDMNSGAYCFGETRYSYITGVKIGDKRNGTGPEYKHVLWRDTLPPGKPCVPLDLTKNVPTSILGAGDDGQELISPNSRLTEFSVTNADGAAAIKSPYKVVVGVAYGDDDLLDNPGNAQAKCKGNIGGQFCSKAKLSTIVVQRTISE